MQITYIQLNKSENVKISRFKLLIRKEQTIVYYL